MPRGCAPISVSIARSLSNMHAGREPWCGANLGESFSSRQPVSRLLLEAAPVSFALGGISLLLTFLIGVPIGMLQAAHRDRALDRITTVLTTAVYAAPTFWIALALVALFTYGAATYGLLPPRCGSPRSAFGRRGMHCMAGLVFADLARVTPYVAGGDAGGRRCGRHRALFTQCGCRCAAGRLGRHRTRKGASASRVYGLHVLRNITPQLVVLGALSLPGLVAGSVFVESVFAWPGLGRAMLVIIQARDYPVVMGATVFYAAAVIFANFAADVALPLFDPRRTSRPT